MGLQRTESAVNSVAWPNQGPLSKETKNYLKSFLKQTKNLSSTDKHNMTKRRIGSAVRPPGVCSLGCPWGQSDQYGQKDVQKNGSKSSQHTTKSDGECWAIHIMHVVYDLAKRNMYDKIRLGEIHSLRCSINMRITHLPSCYSMMSVNYVEKSVV